ncbi:glycosyltransferase family 39 protein [Janthinobacterium sp.]|uniref:glycosyltransferase family 39 protein n=1 Tax=Janthinobacterium sp. TaxID=1871054 RepID=UPI00289DFF30|nr:glycosyltransferase family 39 protein [Janthinobacterium sp.]
MNTAVREFHASKTAMWTLFGLFIAVTLYALSIRTLVPPDEGRYAEMAREMFASGDWITTRLNGIKYFEKPPLQTWMNAMTFAAFGLGDWQARLWTGLCGILGVFMTGYAGRKVFGTRVGLYAGLVLASSLFWLASGQINSLDMGLSGMMTVTLASLLIAQRDEATASERRNWMLLCWAGMALAVLAKGLIGLVLPGSVLILYSLLARDWRIWHRLHLVKGMLVFFAIAAPWFVLVAMRNPEQPYFFFVHEHFQRFLMKGHKREGAWYYFVLLLIPGIMPWLGVLPQSLAAACKRQAGTFQPRLMLLIWAVFIFLFFSYSTSKLPGYIVPVFPALALLTALFLETASHRQRMLAAGVLALLGLVVLVGVPVTLAAIRARDEAHLAALQGYQPWVMTAGALALAGGVLALLHERALRRDMTILTIAVAGFLATHSILAGSELYGQNRAGSDLLPQIRAELKPGTKLYSVSIYEQSLTYYLQRPVTLVAYTDEFAFGLQQQPELSIPKIETFITQWTNDATAGVHSLAIISLDRYEDLKHRGVPMRVVAEDARRMIIANL